MQNFPYLVFLPPFWSLHSSVIPVTGLWGPFRGKYQNDTILWQELHHVYSFSPDFSRFSHYICIGYYIRKCTQTMQIIYQQWWQWSTTCYSTLPASFPDVLVIYALITILGNVHRPCKQYPNIVGNCLQHASSFLLIIPDFLIIFTLLTILGNVHRPYKQYTNIVDNDLHHISLFFSHFFWHVIWTIIGRAT